MGLRSKFTFLLIVYFAGFATAIYCLAPAPQNQSTQPHQKDFACSAAKSDEFVRSFNSGMHKCIDFGKDVASHVVKIIRQKTEPQKRPIEQ